MYDELVKRLRNAAQWADKGLVITPSVCMEAADAIEELQNKLCDWCGVCPKKDVDRGIAKSCSLLLKSRRFTSCRRRRKHDR